MLNRTKICIINLYSKGLNMNRIFFSVGLLSLLSLITVLHALVVPFPLVETTWVEKNLNKIVVLDVRKDIKSFKNNPVLVHNKKSGKLKIKSVGAHIPGAILVDFKKIRVTRNSDGKEVKKLIPLKGDFEDLMQSWGVDRDSTIIIMSKGLNDKDLTFTTRLYWQLKYFGHDNVAILNGGMAKWLLEERAISKTPKPHFKGNWVVRAERRDLLATKADILNASKTDSQLIDNRNLGQYFGVYKKPYVSKKGHLPDAKVFPSELLSTGKSPAKFLEVNKLRALFVNMKIDYTADSITYCNSGHLASGGWFVLHELLGNDNVKLYDGSMHEWTLDKEAKVTTLKIE